MALAVDDGSSERSLKRQPLENGEYGSSDVPTKYKWPKVFAFRDFPEGCRRPNSAVVNSVDVLEADSVEPFDNAVESRVPEDLEDLDQYELVDVSYDLGSDMVGTVIISSDDEEEALDLVMEEEPEGIELLKPLDYVGFVNPLETLKHEVAEFSKEALVETLPKIYYPQRRVSAIRDFPPRCGGSIPNVGQENCLKGIANKGLGHKKVLVEHIRFEKAVRNDVKQEEVQGGDESTSKLNGMFSEEILGKVQAQPEGDGSQLGTTSQIKSGWEDTKGKSVKPPCDSNLSRPEHMSQSAIKEHERGVGGLEGKMGMESVSNMEDRSLNRKVSGVFDNMNKLQGEKPIDSRVGRVIVQALMAVPNCPQGQTKSTRKSNATIGMTGGNGKKH